MKGEIWTVKTPLRRFVEVREDAVLPEKPDRLKLEKDQFFPSYVRNGANDHKIRVRMWHPHKQEFEMETEVALGNFERQLVSPLEQLAACA